MNIRVLPGSSFGKFVCLLLVVAMAAGPQATAFAQQGGRDARSNERGQTERGGRSDGREPAVDDGTGSATPPTRGAAAAAPIRPSVITAAPLAGRIDSSRITADADLVVVLRPAQVLASPNAAMLPVEVASAAGLKYLGLDPADMEEVIAFGKKPAPLVEPPVYGITIKFTKPFNGGAIPPELRGHTQKGELAGRNYLQSTTPLMPSFYAPDSKTLIIAPEATLKVLVEHKESTQPRPFTNRIRAAATGHDIYVAVDVTRLRDEINLGVAKLREEAAKQPTLPPEINEFFDAPGMINAAELTFNLSNSNPSSLLIHGADAANAEKLEKLVAKAVKMYQDTQKASLEASKDPVEKAFGAYVQRMSGDWTKKFRPERNGPRLTFTLNDGTSNNQQQMTLAAGGVLVALLLPAIQAARQAAARNQGMQGMNGAMPNMGQPIDRNLENQINMGGTGIPSRDGDRSGGERMGAATPATPDTPTEQPRPVPEELGPNGERR